MSFTEQDLLADLGSKFKAVGAPAVTTEEDDKGVTLKLVNVFDAADDEGLTPVAVCRNISYYVYNAGQEDEEAFYHPQSLSTPIRTQAIENQAAETTRAEDANTKIVALKG